MQEEWTPMQEQRKIKPITEEVEAAAKTAYQAYESFLKTPENHRRWRDLSPAEHRAWCLATCAAVDSIAAEAMDAEEVHRDTTEHIQSPVSVGTKGSTQGTQDAGGVV